jgi:hypothetical protein
MKIKAVNVMLTILTNESLKNVIENSMITQPYKVKNRVNYLIDRLPYPDQECLEVQ